MYRIRTHLVFHHWLCRPSSPAEARKLGIGVRTPLQLEFCLWFRFGQGDEFTWGLESRCTAEAHSYCFYTSTGKHVPKALAFSEVASTVVPKQCGACEVGTADPFGCCWSWQAQCGFRRHTRRGSFLIVPKDDRFWSCQHPYGSWERQQITWWSSSAVCLFIPDSSISSALSTIL